MWLPRWLAKEYAKLYAELGIGEFAFSQAVQVLDGNEAWGRIVASSLRRAGFLDVLARRGRHRIYRLAAPNEMVLLLGVGVDITKAPEVVRPILRTYLYGLFERCKQRIRSVALYGSFARGDYRDNSDIDLLLVIEGFQWKESLTVEAADRLAYRLWELRHVYHQVQPYPLTPEQARVHRPLYLDLLEDGLILFDRAGFITKVFHAMKARLMELGAVRQHLSDGSWYWILKPHVREGEIIEV